MRIEPRQCRVRQLDGFRATRLGRLASKKSARAFQDLAETAGVEIRTKHKGSGPKGCTAFASMQLALLYTQRDSVLWAEDTAMRIDLHLTMGLWNGLL